jgi:integrase
VKTELGDETVMNSAEVSGAVLAVRLETTKTDAGQRTIPLDPQAIAALDEYVHDHRGTKDGPLFLNARGDPFTYWGFMALFARLSRRLSRNAGSTSLHTGCGTPESRTGSAPASRLSSSSSSRVTSRWSQHSATLAS